MGVLGPRRGVWPHRQWGSPDIGSQRIHDASKGAKAPQSRALLSNGIPPPPWWGSGHGVFPRAPPGGRPPPPPHSTKNIGSCGFGTCGKVCNHRGWGQTQAQVGREWSPSSTISLSCSLGQECGAKSEPPFTYSSLAFFFWSLGGPLRNHLSPLPRLWQVITSSLFPEDSRMW